MQQVLSNLKLIDNDIIIDELISLYNNSVQRGMCEKDYIQLIKQHMLLKNKNEIAIFNYLLNNKNKQHEIAILAKFYRYGIGTEKNVVKAFEYYEKATNKGHVDSMHNLGDCYQFGIGIEKNASKAFEFYNKAAKKDHIESLYQLGNCYQNGIGT